MLTAIEQAIKTRIDQKIASVRDTKIQKGNAGALITPATFVSAEGGKFEQTAKAVFKQDVDIVVELEFKSLRDEEARRAGAHIILSAIVQNLMLQRLDLDIDPLKPQDWRHITDEDDIKSALSRFQVTFKTAYFIEKIDDAIVEDLLSVGMAYFLKPGDDVAEVIDEITLSQEEA